MIFDDDIEKRNLSFFRYNFYIKRPQALAFESNFYIQPFRVQSSLALLGLFVLACACNALIGLFSGGQGQSFLWDTLSAALLQGSPIGTLGTKHFLPEGACKANEVDMGSLCRQTLQ